MCSPGFLTACCGILPAENMPCNTEDLSASCHPVSRLLLTVSDAWVCPAWAPALWVAFSLTTGRGGLRGRQWFEYSLIVSFSTPVEGMWVSELGAEAMELPWQGCGFVLMSMSSASLTLTLLGQSLCHPQTLISKAPLTPHWFFFFFWKTRWPDSTSPLEINTNQSETWLCLRLTWVSP